MFPIHQWYAHQASSLSQKEIHEDLGREIEDEAEKDGSLAIGDDIQYESILEDSRRQDEKNSNYVDADNKPTDKGCVVWVLATYDHKSSALWCKSSQHWPYHLLDILDGYIRITEEESSSYLLRHPTKPKNPMKATIA